VGCVCECSGGGEAIGVWPVAPTVCGAVVLGGGTDVTGAGRWCCSRACWSLAFDELNCLT
jgi:hypothetical protein